MKKTVLIIALAAVLVLSACGKAGPQTAEISLKSNPTTGYSWFAFQNSDLFEITDEYIPDSTDEHIAGSGGYQHFVLKPLKAGECEVSFIYQRPWEAMELGDDYTFNISVSKNLQIKVNGMSAGITGEADVFPEIPEMIIK